MVIHQQLDSALKGSTSALPHLLAPQNLLKSVKWDCSAGLQPIPDGKLHDLFCEQLPVRM